MYIVYNIDKNEPLPMDGRQRDQECSKVIARRALRGLLGVANYDEHTL